MLIFLLYIVFEFLMRQPPLISFKSIIARVEENATKYQTHFIANANKIQNITQNFEKVLTKSFLCDKISKRQRKARVYNNI